MERQYILLAIMLVCGMHISGKQCGRRYPERVRQPAIYSKEPFNEKRYTLEADTDGDVYICAQDIFYNSFITTPMKYCNPAQPLIIKNPQYFSYETRCYFNGKNIVICQHQDGTLSGITNVYATQQQPNGNMVYIGQTRDAYIVKDKQQ